jgi:hypothetical protein
MPRAEPRLLHPCDFRGRSPLPVGRVDFVRGKTKVDVEVRQGEIVTAVVEAGTTGRLPVRNPWPGQAVDVVAGSGNKKVVNGDSGQELRFDAVAGSYLIQKHTAPVTALGFAPVSGAAAHEAKKLGSVQIGIFHDAAR